MKTEWMSCVMSIFCRENLKPLPRIARIGADYFCQRKSLQSAAKT